MRTCDVAVIGGGVVGAACARAAALRGLAVTAFDPVVEDRLRNEVAAQRQAGLRCDWLEPEDVHERWPGAAAECRGALFAPEDGALDPQGLARACLADARRLGATLVPEKVAA